MAAASDPSEIPPEWVGDSAKFTHYVNQMKARVSNWKKLKTKAEQAIMDLVDDPCEDLKNLAVNAYDAMNENFAIVTQYYEWAHVLAGEDATLKSKADKMIAKCNEYDADRVAIESRLKGGMKALRTKKAKQEEEDRKATAKANAEAAANAAASAAAPDPTPDVASVYCEALKPKTQLSTDCRPDVYMEWKTSLKAWMELSGFNKGSNAARTEIIKKCLSTEFAIQIRPFLIEGADPDGSGGIMEVIESAYNRSYPIFAKRIAALTKKIGPNEDIDAFYSKYLGILKEADLGAISEEQWHGMLMIIAVEPIADLREKLLELEGNPTIQEVHDKIQKWRMSKILNKAASKNPAKMNNIKGGPVAQGGRGRGGRGRGGQPQGQQRMHEQPVAPASIKVTPHFLIGKCLLCASPDHARAACPVAHDAKCEICGRDGHRKAACLDAYYKWKIQWEQAGRPSSGPLAAQQPTAPNPAGRGGRGRGRGARGGRGGSQQRSQLRGLHGEDSAEYENDDDYDDVDDEEAE